MLYIIDGTGADPGKKVPDPAAPHRQIEAYDRDMAGSFCNRMKKRFHTKNYERGPDLFARQINTWDLAEHVLAMIKNDPARKTQALYLAGHSRGGAAAIRVAQLLKRENKIVKALFLFDAVDRTVSKAADLAVDVKFIPRNVLTTYHARRDTRLAYRYEAELDIARLKCAGCMTANPLDWRSACAKQLSNYRRLVQLDDAMKVRARSSYGLSLDEASGAPLLSQDRVYLDFGNCGVELEPAISIPNRFNKHIHTPLDAVVDWINPPDSKYVETYIYGSHGALGGSPIGFQDRHWEGLPEQEKQKYDDIKKIDTLAMHKTWHWMKHMFERESLISHAMPCSTPLDPS